MDRWLGRVALVTGASAGIGLALTETLARHGIKVIGCARNIAKIQVRSLNEDVHLFAMVAAYSLHSVYTLVEITTFSLFWNIFANGDVKIHRTPCIVKY